MVGEGIIFPSVRDKKREGNTGIEPVTYRSAVDCSTTELIAQAQYPAQLLSL